MPAKGDKVWVGLLNHKCFQARRERGRHMRKLDQPFRASFAPFSRVPFMATIRLCLVLLVGLATSCGPGDPPDAIVEKVMRETWEGREAWSNLLVGRLTVVDGRQVEDGCEGLTGPLFLAGREKWVQAGIIDINVTKDLTERFTGWTDFRQLAGGARQEVTIEPTALGKSLGEITTVPCRGGHTATRYLKVREGTLEVKEVIRRKPVEIGHRQYVLVEGLYEFTAASRQMQEVLEDVGDYAPEGKFRVLFEYDPFQRKWALKAYDTAKLDQDFLPNVDNYIARQGTDRRAQ